MSIQSTLSGWQRLGVIAAAVWAVPVALYILGIWPSTLESSIKDQWASARVELTWKYHGQGESLSQFRSRVYGDKSSEDILSPQQPTVFDPTTAVPATEVEAVDSYYKPSITKIRAQSRSDIVVTGFIIWLLPLVLLYFLGVLWRWVHKGFQRGPT